MNSPVLLVALPLLLAFISVMWKKGAKILLSLSIVINLYLLSVIKYGVYNIGNWKPPFGIALVLDGYSFMGVLIVNIIFALAVILGYSEVKKYASVLIVSLGAVNGMILTGDLFNLFVFLEIASISGYIISSMTKKYIHSFNYLVIGTVGSSLYLFGIIIFYNIFGTLNMADLRGKLYAPGVTGGILLLPIVLIFAGIAVEAKLFPFNGWVKGVYSSTNKLSGPIFASVYAAAIMFVFGRLFSQTLLIPQNLLTVLIAISLLTLFLAETAAFSGNSLRKILLFSSISQAGLIVTLFLLKLDDVAILQIVNNAVAKLIMFSIAGALAIQAGSDKVEELRGIFNKHKIMGFGFTTAAMSIIGLPMFFGFYVKLKVLIAIFSGGQEWVAVVILISSLIEGIYYIRLLTKLWLPGDEGVETSEEYVTSLSLNGEFILKCSVGILGILIVVMGIMPLILLKI